MALIDSDSAQMHRPPRGQFGAVCEVLLVLSGTLWLVGVAANSAVASRQWVVLGRPFLEYLTLMLVPLVVLVVSRRGLKEFGVSADRLQHNAYGAVVCIVPYSVAHALLLVVPKGAALYAAVNAGLALAVLIISTRLLLASEPAPLLLCMVAPLLIVSPDVLIGAISALVFHICFLGLGEEVLFRGYIQSRLNQAFGRPWRYRGVRLGWGLPIAAVLFGVFHVLNLPQLYAGGLDLKWGFGASTVAWGLFFGYLREWSGSVVAPALVHGVPQGIATAVLG
jgi:uncharacterized protein